MNINRHNYEEYFILYMDNELNAEERRQVENFVTLHPDLKEELDMLLHTQVMPDNRIVFEGKDDLMKFGIASASINSINLSNYDEWLVLYIDNELNVEQRNAVEKFASENPAAKKQLDLFLKTKLQPEIVSFPNKESLYRREEKVRRIPLWFRMAAAAVIVMAVGTTTFLIINNDKNENVGIAKVTTDPRPGTIEKASPSVTTPGNVIQNNTADQNASTTIESAPILPSEEKNTAVRLKTKEAIAEPLQKEEPQVVENVVRNNNLPLPDKNPNVIPDLVTGNLIADNNNSEKKNLTPTPETSSVTKTLDEAYNTGVIADPTAEEEEEQPTGKKNKLRGFFRKVTRTFEKRTSIDPTDGDDRLLVGGLAIKLK